MRAVMIAAATAAMLGFAAQAEAQGRFSIDVRGGAAFGMEDYGTVDLGTGYGFEAAVRYRFMPHLGAYAGWSWYHFSPEIAGEVTEDVGIEDTGYSVGLLFEHPLSESFAGWVRGGGVYDHTELEIDGEDSGDTEHGLGWEAGAGVSFNVRENLTLMPGMRYRTFAPDVADLDDDPTVSYLAAELGLSWKL